MKSEKKTRKWKNSKKVTLFEKTDNYFVLTFKVFSASFQYLFSVFSAYFTCFHGDLRDKLKANSRKRPLSPERSRRRNSPPRTSKRANSPKKSPRDSRAPRVRDARDSRDSRDSRGDSNRRVTEKDEPLPKRDQLHKIQRTIRQSPPRDLRRTINQGGSSRDAKTVNTQSSRGGQLHPGPANSRGSREKASSRENGSRDNGSRENRGVNSRKLDDSRDRERSIAKRAEEEKKRIQREADRMLEAERKKRKAFESQKESELDRMKREMEEMKRQMMQMASAVANWGD